MTTDRGEVTRILSGANALSREEALERLLPLVYDELRELARRRLQRERPDHSLQATALVHEAYIRLVGWTPGLGATVPTSIEPRPRRCVGS